MRTLAVLALLAGTAAAETLDERIDKLNNSIDTGDAWNTTVPKVVAVLGEPNVVSTDNAALGWFKIVDGVCYKAEVHSDGEFVKSTRFNSGGDDTECNDLGSRHAKVPVLKPPHHVEIDELARVALTQIRDGKLQPLFDDAHPDLRAMAGSPAGLAHALDVYAPIAGKLIKIGAPTAHVNKSFGWYVTLPATFEKATLPAELGFRIVDGKPRLVAIQYVLPKALVREAKPADAAKTARTALDLVLAGKIAETAPLQSLDFAQKLRAAPAFEKDVATVLTAVGQPGEIKIRTQEACGHHQCVTFEVHAAHGTALAKLTMTFDVSRWELDGINLDHI